MNFRAPPERFFPMKMVLFPPVDPPRLLKIREAAGEMEVVNAETQARALQAIREADAFFGKLTPELLKEAKNLQWVQSPTASLEHYLFPELISHRCLLSNMRGLFSDVIADHVMSCVLCFARNLHVYLRQQREHLWEPIGGETARGTNACGPGHVTPIDRAHQHLSDCTLGVVGVGHIGREICKRASAFGMKLLGIDPVCRSLENLLPDVWPTEQLPKLLEHSDFVVIAAPHTPETEKLFGAEQFRQMKSTARLINIGRGVIVDLVALTNALQTGEIAGAALDVFEKEPLPADHPLWDLPNVILTPHIAAASPRIAERHLETLLENVRRFIKGEDPITLVDKHRWF
jgi:phosphoglycerate dehydrogenase-like enzyme